MFGNFKTQDTFTIIIVLILSFELSFFSTINVSIIFGGENKKDVSVCNCVQRYASTICRRGRIHILK
jgi:hypothetical protein